MFYQIFFPIKQIFSQVQEAVHPAARSQSYLSLRATYTVGSMAGLGFSMAVVGLSIGM